MYDIRLYYTRHMRVYRRKQLGEAYILNIIRNYSVYALKTSHRTRVCVSAARV